MTHRQARKKLGTRTARRSGVKSKAINGATSSAGGNDPQFRYFRYQGVERPRVRVAALRRTQC